MPTFDNTPSTAHSNSDPTPATTLPVSVGAERLGVSEDWYLRQLRKSRFPGRKIGRSWRLTESDIRAAIEIVARPAVSLPPTSTESSATPGSFAAGLTPRSRRYHFGK